MLSPASETVITPTAVEFSATLYEASAIIWGPSFTLVTEISRSLASLARPSLTTTVTLYTLSEFASVGASKSGAALKDNVVPVKVTRDESSPV